MKPSSCLLKSSSLSVGRVLLIVAFVFVAHAVVLSGDFKSMDDEASIVTNPLIQDWQHLPRLFTTSFFGGNAYYRPLVSVSFLLEYHLFGLNPFFYYLTNLLLHAATSVGVYWLLLVFLRWGRQEEKTDASGLAALVATLFFAIHPLHTEVLSNIAGRAILLCAFFYVAAFGTYVQAQLSGSLWCRRWLLLSLVSFAAALLSKESAVTFPGIIGIFELLHQRRYLSLWDRFKNLSQSLLPYVVLLGGYFGLRVALNIGNVALWGSATEMFWGVSTFVRALGTYARLVVWPVGLYFDRSLPYFASGQEGLLWAMWGILTGIVWLLWATRRRFTSATWFFMAWMGVTFIPVAQLIPIRTHTGFAATSEHFTYLPLIGLCGVVAGGVYLLKKRCTPRVCFILVSGILGLFITLSVTQNIRSSQELVMFADSLMAEPTNTRMRISYALALAKVGDFQEAEQHFRTALTQEPHNAQARIGLGKALVDQGHLWAGIEQYNQMVHAGKLEPLRLDNRRAAMALLLKKYQQRLIEEPGNAALHYSMGVLYSLNGELPQALGAYRQALQYDPRHVEALFNGACTLEALGQSAEARGYYQRVLDLPDVEQRLREEALQRINVMP